MKNHRVYVRLFVIIFTVVIVCSSCSPPTQSPDSPAIEEDDQFATSESALTNEEIELTMYPPIDPFAPDERKFPPGFGDTRLEYNHLIKFDQTLGSMGLKIEVEIIDYVPINYIEVGEGPRRSGGDTQDWVFFKVSGDKELQVNGKGFFIYGGETCDCKFSDTIDVSIEGITHPVWGPENCDDIVVSLAFNETWYTNPEWVCDCEDPVKNVLADMFAQIPSGSPPGIEEHTMQFSTGCPGQYLEEYFVGMGGTGTYRWTWRPGDNERGDPFVTQSAPAIDQDIYGWGGPPSCVSSGGGGHWGPPLSSIDNGVLEWFPYISNE